MYENKTFENILSTMLTNVSEQDPDLDTRTGSIIYTALAPIAMELETAYREMDMILEETFVSTASKDYLVEHGKQIGVDLNFATCGHYKGEFDVDLTLGSRFNGYGFNYTVLNKISDPTEDNQYYTFELVCETAGSEPNGYLGDILPITFIQNLSHAKLVSIRTPGEDEEETEEYRARILAHVQNPPIDGNVYQYNEWLDEYPENKIGKYRVTPCWNGANTVKLTILNSDDKPADPTLVSEVQEYFDPQSRGMGDGQAPIGAIVTVDTATKIDVVVKCQLELKDGYKEAVGVQDAVEEYLNSIVFDKTTIGYMPIAAEIYNAESVEDVTSLTITVKGTVMDKDATQFIDSVTIGSNEVAVLDAENSVWGV